MNLNRTVQWAEDNDVVRGVSPRWIVPVGIGRTDGLVLVADTARERSMGIGVSSNLDSLKKD